MMKWWHVLVALSAASASLLATPPVQANVVWLSTVALAQAEPDGETPAAEPAGEEMADEAMESAGEDEGPKEVEEAPTEGAEEKPEEEKSAEEKPDEAPPEAAEEKPGSPRDPRVETVLPTAPTEVQRILGKPVTVEQFYRVIDRDIAYGQIEDAKAHAAELLAHPELTDEMCVRLQDKYGGTLPVRMMLVPELREEGEKLGARMQAAARAVLRDPKRIRHVIDNLAKSEGHRSFALRQLRLAGVDAVPVLIEAIRAGDERRADFEAALYELDPAVWPAVAATLDADDPMLLTLAIGALREYGNRGAADWLWYVSAANRYPSSVREQAKVALAALTGTPIELLPAASDALRRVADRHYRHEGGLGESPETVRVWRWVDGALVSSEESISAAEEYFGSRAARQALDLDPGDRAAAVTLLSLALDKAGEKQGIETLLAAPSEAIADGVAPAPPEVLAARAAGPELLEAVLDRALREGRTAVAIGAARALGATGSSVLLDQGPAGPGVLARALGYPDLRVQFAAAVSALELRPTRRFPQAGRVVEILASALDPTARPRAVVISQANAQANELSYLLREIGQVPLIAASGKDGFRQASESAGVERIFLFPGFQQWDLVQTLVNLRADARTAWIPVFVFAAKPDKAAIDHQLARFARVHVLPPVADKEKLTKALELTQGGWEDRPLTDQERVWLQGTALGWIHRIVRGEYPTLDARPATEALAGLLENPTVGPLAADALGYLPSAAVQGRLALALGSPNLPEANRVAACDALARNIQLGGVALDNKTLKSLLALRSTDSKSPAALALARLLGSLRPDRQTVARRILDYRPAPPAPREEEKPAASGEAPPAEPGAEEEGAEEEAAEMERDEGDSEPDRAEPDPGRETSDPR